MKTSSYGKIKWINEGEFSDNFKYIIFLHKWCRISFEKYDKKHKSFQILAFFDSNELERSTYFETLMKCRYLMDEEDKNNEIIFIESPEWILRKKKRVIDHLEFDATAKDSNDPFPVIDSTVQNELIKPNKNF